ncbi:DTW domain-containing protein [Criblamydia sequanensis]|uniref:tRNA-uridine aminocarboxypropyltransferase n=1 Tax=Candidatus Criblamydia sequanensis CRIB-18 TaxID=1437425 RepID=A0A090CYZ2_9BACT|nr:DTW domain-containing protein [Criblamydia sequanensis]CDR33856.1 Conserved hypothetical protein [Criblamydia sequanensis CRIB-18]
MIYPKTIVLRHKKENLKKCSLRGLENRSDFQFLTYPKDIVPKLSQYIVLSFEGKPLSCEDEDKGLFIIDGTWKYAEVMARMTPAIKDMETRSLPAHFKTAYPRRQEDCPFEERGLASIEAIYIAYHILKRPLDSLLDSYFWKENFLKINDLP